MVFINQCIHARGQGTQGSVGSTCDTVERIYEELMGDLWEIINKSTFYKSFASFCNLKGAKDAREE